MSKKYLDYNGLLYFWQKLKAYFATISHTHTKSEITDFPSTMTPSSHTHGNITNAGALQATDVAVANGDKLVVTDSSNSSKVARTSVAFDGTTANKVLAKKGDWVDFPTEVDKANTLKTARTIDGVEFNGSAGIIHYGVCSSAAQAAAKTVDCAGFTLVTGAWIAVKFTYENTSPWSGVTLNVNNTGAKNIKYRGGASVSELAHLQLDNTILMLVYDGTNYEVVGTMTHYSGATTSASGLMSATDKTKLNGIAAGAEVNVQSDWSQSDSTADDYIKNKPTLGAAAAKGVVSTISSDSTDLPTVTAVKSYISTAITGAASFQGTAPTTFAPTNYKKGYYWVVGTAGTYVGETCEPGDMIFAVADYNSAYSASDFNVIQTNLDITDISNGDIDTMVAS